MTTSDQTMTNQAEEDIGRRQAVRIIHTRGTHYDIGFDIVRIRLFFFDSLYRDISIRYSYYSLTRFYILKETLIKVEMKKKNLRNGIVNSYIS